MIQLNQVLTPFELLTHGRKLVDNEVDLALLVSLGFEYDMVLESFLKVLQKIITMKQDNTNF
jgi:hypothetical protein